MHSIELAKSLQRELAKSILAEIAEYEPFTCFCVHEDGIHIFKRYTYNKDILPLHADMIREHRQALIEYLTTPPTISGMCIHGHEIEWTCTQYGVWVCKCYYEYDRSKYIVRKSASIVDYWVRGTK